MPILLSRQELYDKVWNSPIQKLSKEFGLSDVGLAKVCHRYAIPVPPRGYWAKVRAGKSVSKLPMPLATPMGVREPIEFPGPDSRPTEPAPVPEPQHPLIAAESEPANAITVRDDLRVTHPLLRGTREAWKLLNNRAFQWNVPIPTHLHVPVSRPLWPRALRILQALFSAFDQRGFKVSANERKGMKVTILDEGCVLTMRERQRQVRSERRRRADQSLFPDKRPFDLVDTGELELTVEKPYGRKATVGDDKNQRVEDQLNDIIVGLVEAALEEKDIRAARERQRLAEAERERERAKAKQRERARRDRIKRFEEMADAALRHKQLLAFRDELQQAVGTVDVESELGRWLAWVDEHVDRFDVLARFRSRHQVLTLYHCMSTWSVDHVLAHGFKNAEPGSGEDQELPSSVTLTDVPMEGVYGGTACVVIEAPEEDMLPYESIGKARAYRLFRVPAEIANRFERRVDSE
jgi:hypothetical protein